MTLKKQLLAFLCIPLFILMACKGEVKKKEQTIREQLGLPEQNLTKEEIEEIKRTVKPIKFETVEEAKAFLDSLEKSFEENSIKTISEEEYQKAIDTIKKQEQQH